MIRFLRLVFLGIIAILLITVALANRQVVTLRLLPDDLAALLGLAQSLELPLFAVIFGAIAVGVLIGFVWEWLREHKHRATAVTKTREVTRLEREVARNSATNPKDEILALLDAPGKPG